MAVNLIAYRGRNDDGNETTATWKAAQNTAWVQAFDVNFRVRFLHQNDTAQILNLDILLQYSLNGGAYTAVSATSLVVRSSASPNLADAANLTTQLTGGTGTYVGATGFDEVNGICGGTSMDVTATGHFETEFCVQLRSADVSLGDTVTLRTFNNDAGAAWGTYTVVATLTAPLPSGQGQIFSPKPPLGAQRNFGHPLSIGCVSHWLMNEGGGASIYDASGLNNLGSFAAAGAAPTWGTGFYGHAVVLDGTDDYIDTATLAGVTHLTPFSIVIWVKFLAPAADSMHLITTAQNVSPFEGVWTYLNTGENIAFDVNGNSQFSGITTNTSPLSYGIPYQIAFTRDGSNTAAGMKIYIDAVERSVTAVSATPTALTNRFWRIGSVHGTPAGFGNIAFDQIRIYNRTLSSAEVAWLYADPFADMVRRPSRQIGRRAAVAPTFVPFPFRGDGGFDNMMGGLR